MTTIRVYIATLIFMLLGVTQLFFGCASQQGAAEDAGKAQASSMRSIQDVTTNETDEAVYVVISADGPLTFSSLKKPDPPAVLLVFPETSVSQLPAEKTPESPAIERIVASDGNGGRTARLELKLAADMPYTASKEGDTIWLTFAKNSVAPAPPAPAETTPSVQSAPPASDVQAAPAVAAPQPPETEPVYVPKTTAWVNKIDFLSESEGKSTLVVGTTHAVHYKVQKISSKKIDIRLLNTRIPSYRQRALITTRFTSAVDRIVPYQNPKAANEAVVSIELREAVPYFSEQADDMLLVHFDASNVPPKPMEQAQLPPWKRAVSDGDVMPPVPEQGVAVPAGDTDAGVEPMPAAVPQQGVQPVVEQPVMLQSDTARSMMGSKRLYTGEKIAIDFYETDIKNVFRILREVSGKNFAIDKNVEGKVTMTLEKPVPWDQVLDLVLRMNQLGLIYEGDIVRIATLETLKKEDELRRSKLEAMRKAQEEARALEPLVTQYIPVSYSDAADEVVPHLKQILTKDRGSVSVDTKNNQVIITDTAEVVQQAQEVVLRIDRVTSQVLIAARIVEVSDTFSRDLGISWGGSYGPGVIPGTGWGGTGTGSINLPGDTDNSFGINFSRLSGVPFVLNATLDAAEATGEGRILSSPKILTLDNKKAKIKQGLEYPYTEKNDQGELSTKFKQIDLLLEVTPHVTPDNRVSMAIKITKNDVAELIPGPDGDVPSIATNEAETELLINDGDTIVIGGIIKATDTNSQARVPGLANIPILGWLFKNTSKSKKKNELLIFITPSIVRLEKAAN